MTLRRFTYTLLLMTLVFVSSCSSDKNDEPVPDTKEQEVILQLNVSVGENSSVVGSRADKGDQDGYEEPVGTFETLSTLRVMILHQDGTLEANRKVRVDANGQPIDDNLEFEVTDNETKTIYLIGNEEALPLPLYYANPTGATTVGGLLGSLRINDVVNTTALRFWTAGFSTVTPNESLFYSSTSSRLPMTEVFTVNTSDAVKDAESNTKTLTANLFLTRAASKATFRFNFEQFEGGDAHVTGVRLKGLSKDEYVFPNDMVYRPAKYSESGSVNPSADGKRYIESFSAPRADATAVTFEYSGDQFSPVAMEQSSDPVKRGPVYFAESRSNMSQNAYSVEVQIDGGSWLDAKPLTTNILSFGGAEAISRNTHLYIDITFTPVDIVWQAIEAPYNTVTLNPEFGNPITVAE